MDSQFQNPLRGSQNSGMTFKGLKTQTTESCAVSNTYILDMIHNSPDFDVFFMFFNPHTILCGWMVALTN